MINVKVTKQEIVLTSLANHVPFFRYLRNCHNKTKWRTIKRQKREYKQG